MADELTEVEISELKDAFALFDKNNDGFINFPELKDIVVSLGNNPSDSEIERMIHELDADGDGSIDFPEFLIFMSKNFKKRARRSVCEELKDAFNVFDRNGDGYITHEEMKRVLDEFEENLSDKDVAEMIKEADQDGDGKINYQEFIAAMAAKQG